MDIDQREREKESVCVCVCKTDHANMIKWLEDFAKNAEVFEWDQSPLPLAGDTPSATPTPPRWNSDLHSHDHLTSNCSNGQQVQTLPFGTAQYGILCQPVQAQRLCLPPTCCATHLCLRKPWPRSHGWKNGKEEFRGVRCPTSRFYVQGAGSDQHWLKTVNQ